MFCSVFFAVRTEFLNIIYTSFGFKVLNTRNIATIYENLGIYTRGLFSTDLHSVLSPLSTHQSTTFLFYLLFA
jgi:hypothetical protein